MMRKPGFLGFTSGWTGFAVLGLLVALGFAAVAGTAYWAHQAALEELRDKAANTLAVYSVGLEEVMNKYRAVTVMLSNRDDVRAILADAKPEITRSARGRAIAFADRQAFLAGADELRIIRSDGEIVGSGGPVNRAHVSRGNLAYRSYFIDAMQGRLGRFINLRANEEEGERRSYIFASPVREGSRIVGVLALEVGLAQVESAWFLSPDPVGALDDSGQVLLSNQANLIAQRLPAPAPLAESPPASPALPEAGAPGGVPAESARTQSSAGEVKLVRPALPGLEEKSWIEVDRPMPVLGWTLRMLADPTPATGQASQAAVIAFLIYLLGAGAILVVLNRRADLVRRVRSERASALRLERRVRDRTRALKASNLQLAREVREREAAEEELRQTQSELIQAAKMAVIGQMSTALSHEFNQPLGAIRSYSENAETLLKRGRVEEAQENLRLVGRVVERMASLSRHLKSFARKPGGSSGPVKLGPVIDEVSMLLSPRMKAEQVAFSVEAGGSLDYVVEGDRVRLSQVLVNIVANSIDALAGRAEKRVVLIQEGSEDGQRLRLRIEDNGPGVAPEYLDSIFDPFFTTKEVGSGLGIGLSIANSILRDLGGRLDVENREEGGARFTVTLLLAERRKGAA
jgi:two-component system C4-dicarboxylate transport sensor histidine kinase DctB